MESLRLHSTRTILTLASLFAALTVATTVPARPQHSPDAEIAFHTDVEKLLSAGEVSGMSIAIVRNGRVAGVHNFGWRNSVSKRRIENDTVFEAASLSKPVVAYAVLRLIDKGLLAIDEPVSKYVDHPELHDDGRWKSLTVRMLLDHTSGLPNELRPGERASFSFEPGTRFSYSGVGFSLLQQVVERVTGLPFETYLEKAVFEPLHMTSSSFVWRQDYETRKANGHDSTGQPRAIRKPVSPSAASSLHTTAKDYARFLAAVLNRSGLTASSWKAMVQPQIQVQQGCVVCIRKPTDRLSPVISWGLGWGLEKVGSGWYLFHWGENNGDFQAFVEGDPRTRTGIVILTNSGNGLSIVPAIVQEILPAQHEAFGWMGYESYDSPFRTVLRRILAEGPDKALMDEGPQLNESQWNRIGYNLLARSKVSDAIQIFERNVSLYPASSNAYDSLGEGYAAAGRNAEAIESYKKSLALDSRNDNARQMIQKLQNANHPASLEPTDRGR